MRFEIIKAVALPSKRARPITSLGPVSGTVPSAGETGVTWLALGLVFGFDSLEASAELAELLVLFAPGSSVWTTGLSFGMTVGSAAIGVGVLIEDVSSPCFLLPMVAITMMATIAATVMTRLVKNVNKRRVLSFVGLFSAILYPLISFTSTLILAV